VNSSLLLFQGNLADFGSHVFGQQTACTASEELQFMTMTNMTVPVEEVQRFAIKTWQSPNSVGAQIQNVTYFDLETGRIVTGNTVYDWNRALTYFNYTILLPNIVDMPAYQHKMLQLNYTVSNLTTGQTTASRSCQSPIPQLKGVSDYLNSVLNSNLSNPASLDGGLRPTELKLPGGCISESSVNYEGTVLQSIRTGKTSQVIHQDTCPVQLCLANALLPASINRAFVSDPVMTVCNASLIKDCRKHHLHRLIVNLHAQIC